MAENSIALRIREIAQKIATMREVEFVHSEVVGTKRDSVVRIYIDKADGLSIEHCSGFSSAIEEVLDADDFIPGKYVLEVSSPGIERELYSLDDVIKFVGRLMKIKAKIGIESQKTFVGVLESVDDEVLKITDRTIGEVLLPYADVAKANLKIDLQEEFKRK